MGPPAAESAPGLGGEQSLEGSLARSDIGAELSKGSIIAGVPLQRVGNRPNSWILCPRELKRCDLSGGQLIEEHPLKTVAGRSAERLDDDVADEFAKERTDRHDRDPFEVASRVSLLI